ncbi:hypothetical protein PRECH8_18730 [Insulibacter thermoxylanivorax]|uniref:Uncharacterized protein n=1 Tax=Insulibacter thermoxylanivorax TaxID=2749268 RepID=A0A916QHP4_9BACL|nr:hypothetical protein PRECH8_18730 [Insulibacter thermoxylanivorax]
MNDHGVYFLSAKNYDLSYNKSTPISNMSFVCSQNGFAYLYSSLVSIVRWKNTEEYAKLGIIQ